MSAPRSGRVVRAGIAVAALVALSGCALVPGQGQPRSGSQPAPTASGDAAESDEDSAAPGAPPAADDTDHGVFEATGSGTATTIDIDPPGPRGAERAYNAPLPWKRSFTASPDDDVLQVVVVGGNTPGCRIILDGEVVAEQPRGGSAHCTYDRN